MAKDKKSKTPVNNAGRPTGSYSSYGTSGYGSPSGGYGGPGGYGAPGGGYGGYGAGGRGPSPYGGYAPRGVAPQAPAPMQQQAPAPVNEDVKGKKGKEKAAKSQKNNSQNTENMSRKEKKLAKRQEKFQEDQLKYYPMTVGAWIGTFILLAIPLVGGICAICWFFGVGNRSRVAWVRSKLVIVLLIIALIAALLGVGYGVVASKAKNVDLTFDGVSYGKLGDYKAKGVVYYLACFAVDTFGESIINVINKFMGGSESSGGEVSSGEAESGESSATVEDAKNGTKFWLAQKILGIKKKEASSKPGNSTGQIGSGSLDSGSAEAA